jgi:TP901 family phage tail tape measure protein
MAYDEIEGRLKTIREDVDKLARVDIMSNAKGKIKSAVITYTDSLGKVTQEFMGWGVHLDRVNEKLKRVFKTTGFKFTDDVQKADNAMQSSLTTLNKYQLRLEKIKTSYDLPSGVKDQGRLDDLNSKYNTIIATIEKYKTQSTALSAEQKRDIDKQISNLVNLSNVYKATEKTAEKGFNFKQYKEVTNEVAHLKNGTDAYTQSLLANHKIISATVKETAQYYQVNQQLQQGNYIKNIGVYIDKATGKVYEFTRSIRNNMVDTITWEKAVATAVKRVAQWFVGTAITAGFFTQMRNMIKYTTDMDTALTELSKVVDMTKGQMDDMRVSAISMGKELGQSSIAIAQGMAEWGRYTKDMKEIQELTRTSTMAANVTNLSVAEASKSLISTMIQYKISAKDSMTILDQWNEIQNNFRTSAIDLADALGTVGSVASQMGVKIQTLEGYVTALVSSMGISGEEAGTALKSMISRVYRIGAEGAEDAGKTEEQLKKIGVAVRDSEGNFRSFDKILEDVKSKWQDLTNVEKVATAQQIGGTYHYAKVTSLLENLNIASSATEKALNSQNSAWLENQKYMESIQGRYATFKTTLEETYSSLLSSDFAKGFVSVMTGLVNGLNTLMKIFGGLPTIIGLATLSLSLFSKEFKTAISSFTRTLPVIGSFEAKLINLQKSLEKERQGLIRGRDALQLKIQKTEQAGKSAEGYSKSLGVVRTKLIGVALQEMAVSVASAALETALSVGLSFAINGLINLIGSLIPDFDKMRQEVIDLSQTVSDNIKSNTDNIKSLGELSAEYDILSGKQSLTTEESKRLYEIKRQIADMFPELVTGWDSETGQINIQKKSIAELVSLLKERNTQEEYKLIQGGQKAFDVYINDINTIDQKLKELQAKRDNYLYGKTSGNITFYGIDQLKEMLKTLEDAGKEVDPTTLLNTSKIKEMIASYEVELKNLTIQEEQLIYSRKVATDTFKPYVNAILNTDQSYNKLDKTMQQFVQNYINSKNIVKGDNWNEVMIKVRGISEAFSKAEPVMKVYTDKIQELNGMYNDGKIDADEYNKQLIIMAEYIAKIIGMNPVDIAEMFRITPKSLQPTVKTLAELSSEFDGVNTKIKDYKAIQEELNTLGRPSAESIKLITEKYQNLIPFVTSNTTLHNALTDALGTELTAQNDLATAIATNAVNAQTVQIGLTNMTIGEVKKRIEAYGAEITAMMGATSGKSYYLDSTTKAMMEAYADALRQINNIKKELVSGANYPKPTGSGAGGYESASEIGKETAEAYLKGWEDQLDEKQDEISLLGKLDSPEEKAKKAEILRDMNTLLDSEGKAVDAKIDEIKKQMAGMVDNKANKQKLTELDTQLDDLVKKRRKIEIEIVGNKGEIDDLIKELASEFINLQKSVDEKLLKSIETETKKNIREKQDEIDDLETETKAYEKEHQTIIDGYKEDSEAFEKDHEAKIKGYQDDADEFEKTHQAVIDGYEEESEKFEKEHQVIIDGYQAQIDAINAQADALDEVQEREQKIKDIEQARLDLQKAQQKLSNVQSERNVKLFQNGAWTWVADPRAVEEAKNSVDSANQSLQQKITDFNKWEADMARKHQIEQLQAQIDAEQKLIDDKKAYYDEKIKAEQKDIEDTRAYYDGLIKAEQDLIDTTKASYDTLIKAEEALIKKKQEDNQALIDADEVYIKEQQRLYDDAKEKFDAFYSDLDTMTATWLDTLNKTYDGNLQKILDTIIAKVSAMKSAMSGIPSSGAYEGYVTTNTDTGKPVVHVNTDIDAQILRDQYGDAIEIKQDGGFVGADREETNAHYKDVLSDYGLTPDTLPQDIWQYFDTGGYTGDKGGMAILHKKELVLNEADTKNILKAINIIKPIGTWLDNRRRLNLPDVGRGSSNSTQNLYTFNNMTVRTNDAKAFLNNLLLIANRA